jgi:hypothetical protein
MTYTIPSTWIYLERNKMNIVASAGTVKPNATTSNYVSSGGIFSYITGFAYGNYQPGVIEIVYKAGFENDRLPAMVADLITTWAARRMLMDLAPVLFPSSSVSVGVDGVNQSVGYRIQDMLTVRLQMMEAKENQLKNSFKSGFGMVIQTTFLGV